LGFYSVKSDSDFSGNPGKYSGEFFQFFSKNFRNLFKKKLIAIEKKTNRDRLKDFSEKNDCD